MHLSQADQDTALALVPNLRKHGVVYVVEDHGLVVAYAAAFTDTLNFFGHDLYSLGPPEACAMLLQRLRHDAGVLGYAGVLFDTDPRSSPVHRLGKRAEVLSERTDDKGNVINIRMMLPKTVSA